MSAQGQVILLKPELTGKAAQGINGERQAEFRANAVSMVVRGFDFKLDEYELNSISFDPNDPITSALSPTAARIIEAVNGVYGNGFVGRMELIQYPFQNGEEQVVCIKPTTLIRDYEQVAVMPTVIGCALSHDNVAQRVEQGEIVGAVFEPDLNLTTINEEAAEDVEFYMGLPPPIKEKNPWGYIAYPIVRNQLLETASRHGSFAFLVSKGDDDGDDYGIPVQGPDGKFYLPYKFVDFSNYENPTTAEATGELITGECNRELMRIYNGNVETTVDNIENLPVQIVVEPQKVLPKGTFGIIKPEVDYGEKARLLIKSEGLKIGQTHQYTPEIIQYIVQAAELDDHNPQKYSIKHLAASLYAQGLGVERDEAKAIQYYEDVVVNKSDFYQFSAMALAIRLTFGLGVERDLIKAKKLITDVIDYMASIRSVVELADPDRKKEGEIDFQKEFQTDKNLFIDILKDRELFRLIERLLEHAHEPEYQAAIQYIQTDYQSETCPNKILNDFQGGRFKVSEATLPIIGAITMLARYENWRNLNEWNNTFDYIHLAHHGFDPNKIMSDTLRFGPFYNAVSDTGLPILGDLQDSHHGTPDYYTGEPIEPGIIAFDGLTATSKGVLKLHFTESATDPALLLQEDIDTALALVFGYEKPIWPSIDMPFHTTKDGQLRNINVKKFEPEWLAETIGPTLHITDVLGGKLSWSFDEFEFAENELGTMASDLIDQIKAIKAQIPRKTVSHSINVSFTNAYLGIDENTDPSGTTIWDIGIGRVDMRISGGYGTIDESGTEQEWQYRDNLGYKLGQICGTLTDNFDTIAKVLPVYERLRQFTGMVYALNELRGKGFKPNAELQAHIDRKKAEFESRVAGKPPEYARSLPLFERRPAIGY